jgi:hypothetical protein
VTGWWRYEQLAAVAGSAADFKIAHSTEATLRARRQVPRRVALRTGVARRYCRPVRLSGVAAALALLMLAAHGPTQANASGSIFRFFSSICVTVYETGETFKSAVRDDLAEAVAPRLGEGANKLRKGLRVAARPRCIPRSEPSAEQQMMLDLYVMRQQVPFESGRLSSVMVGGSAPNALGPLSPHELLPIVILDRSSIDDRRIEDALIRFFDSTVLELLRTETAK